MVMAKRIHAALLVLSASHGGQSMTSLSKQIASIVDLQGRIAVNSLVNWLRALSPDSCVPGFLPNGWCLRL